MDQSHGTALQTISGCRGFMKSFHAPSPILRHSFVRTTFHNSYLKETALEIHISTVLSTKVAAEQNNSAIVWP